MSAMIMNHPQRKPVPSRFEAPAAQPYNSIPPPPAQRQVSTQFTNGQEQAHLRTRTNSSNMNGTMSSQTNPAQTYSMTSQQYDPNSAQSRRTLSNVTSSTSSSTNAGNMQRVSTNSTYGPAAGGVRRSTSSRSNSSISPTSYVALMRKQKATVWCDRAQHEDPRILMAQRQAKMRAAAEVAGGHNYLPQTRVAPSGQGVVGGVRSKIRHHGAPKASAYTGVGGAGVPIRMSASEVDEGDSEDDGGRYHARTGSGRSSLGSGRRVQSFQGSGLNAYSNGSTPPTGHSPVESMGDLLEEETPVPDSQRPGEDYFATTGGSGSSGERGEETFGTVGGLPHMRGKPSAQELAEKDYSADELRRRGSVDDRSMTMTGVRLFVANPDLSD